MAQLVIAAAGAAIGAATGFGPQAGWLIGSAIGGAFGPKLPDQHIEGPRLSDLKVTGTEYGQVIPRPFGSPRLAGQMVWASDRREVAHTQSQTTGGKGGGGGGQTVTQTTYTYDIDVLILLTDIEIAGVTRIWENGKLEYNALDESWAYNEGLRRGYAPGSGFMTGLLAEVATSALNSQSSPRWDRITVYTGAADQLPDPTYEAAVGSANAPAYRGRGAVFIQGWHLGESGALPNLTFEVYGVGSTQLLPWAAESTGSSNWSISASGNGIHVMVAGNSDQAAVSADNGVTWSAVTLPVSAIWSDMVFGDGKFVLISWASGGSATFLTTTDGVSWASHVVSGSHLWHKASFGNGIFLAVAEFEAVSITSSDGGATWTTHAMVGVSAYTTWRGMDFGNGYFIVSEDSNKAFITADGIHYTQVNLPITSPAASYGVAYGGGTWVITGFNSAHAAISTDNGATWTLVSLPSSQSWIDVDYGNGTFVAIGNGSAVSAKSTDYGLTWVSIAMSSSGAWNSIRYGLNYFIATQGDPGIGRLVTSSVIITEPPTIAQVVSDLCLGAGLSADQFDIAGLGTITKPVRALAVSQVSPTRSTLDMLMASHYFELTVSDKLYFRPRGGAAVATIPYADLGASLGGNPVEPLAIHQATDIELPAQVAVTYANINNDYQTDTQFSDRLVTAVTNTVQTVQVALGMTAEEAKGIADTAAFDQMIALHSTGLALLGDYARLESTDVVNVTGADGSIFRVRLLKKKDSYPLLEFDAVFDDASVLIDQGITSTDYTPSTLVAALPATLMELMDIPILRDADNDAGFYVAAKGDNTPWPGANIYSSTDDISYGFEDTVGESAVFGSCATTLGDWTGPRVFDETNSVTIDIGAGTTSSVTRAEILADQSINAWLIGSEIIQARDATLISTGVYKLTGLLRGGRGTEWAMTGHVASERCVRLQTTGLRRIDRDTGSLGFSHYFKGVTLGNGLASATGEAFTDNGIGLKPFSPVDLRASRDVSGDISFTWRRRTRLATRMVGPLGGSVPLGEESEAYDVLIYSDNTYTTLLRTLSATSATVTYSSAQQTADFGSNQAMVYARIYQRSARVGRGYPLEAAA